MDKLLKYTDLLHQYQDPNAQEVREFIQRYADDVVFSQRVQKLNALFLLKAATESTRAVEPAVG